MTCEALIALLHSGFHESKWTDQEIGFAMGRNIPTFSVRCGEDPYGFIGRFQAFNGLSATPKDLAKEIWQSLLRHKETQRRMCDAVIQVFEESDSFNEAQARVKLLEELTMWDASFEKRLNNAIESNYQISNAFYVPGKVKTLINKWKSPS